MMHVNFAPVLKAVPLASSPELYLVEGRAASGQLAVFASEPGEPTYSPIWKEMLLTWKPSATPVLIKSDTQIDQLEKKGELTERATATRLNCPIIKVGGWGHPALKGVRCFSFPDLAPPDPVAIRRLQAPPESIAEVRSGREGSE
jgi:hypothetical protein